MQRCKTTLSVLFVPLLAGAAAGTAVHAEPPARWLAPAQTSAQTRASTSGDQTESLRRPVTLDLVDAPLGSALEAITRQAGLTFAYSPTVLPAGRTVTLHASAMPAGDALTRVLDGTGLEPTMMPNGHLTLVRQPEPSLGGLETATVRAQQAVVTGTVTDAGTSEPLRGAEVRVDDSKLTTVTDAEGRYTLEDVPPGTHTLVAAMLGYSEARREATVADGTTASVDFALPVSAVPLDEVIVTGTMVPTQLRAVPSSASVLTAADIASLGTPRFENILRSIPGLGIVSSNGEDARLFHLYVRGANTLSANTIKTYIDGVELANPVYSLNQIDPASIQRIELVRGPQASTLHGSEAIAGVLQIFTKKGHAGGQTPSLEANFSGGSLESKYEEGFTPVQNHSIRITAGENNVSFSLGGSYRYTGEWVEDKLIDRLGWELDNSASRDVGLSAGLRYTSGNITAEASARVHSNSAGYPLSRALADRARTGEWNYIHATKPQGVKTSLAAQTYGLNIEYDATPGWRHHFAIGHDGTAVDYRQPQPRQTTPVDTLLYYQLLDWQRQSIAYRTALEFDIDKNTSTTVQAGFDQSFYNQREVLTLDATSLAGALGNQSANLTLGELSSHGFFVQTQVALRNRLFLTAGLRGDRSSGFGDNFGYAWSPRAGIAHVFDIGATTLKARASYGTAIRSPQPEQKLGRIGGNFVTLPNEKLSAEVQTGYDVGLELHIARILSVAVTHYEQTAKDLVALVRLSDPTVVPTVQQHQNVGQIKNRGWEFEASMNIAGLAVKGHYSVLGSTVEQLSPSYTGTNFVIGQRPLWIPRTAGGLSVTHATPQATVTIAMTHKGSWHAYRNLQYYEARLGTDPDREPYTGNRRDYVDAYDPVRRFTLNGRYRITTQMTALLNIDNLLNDNAPDRSDIDLVKGRQITIGMRMAMGI